MYLNYYCSCRDILPLILKFFSLLSFPFEFENLILSLNKKNKRIAHRGIYYRERAIDKNTRVTPIITRGKRIKNKMGEIVAKTSPPSECKC